MASASKIVLSRTLSVLVLFGFTASCTHSSLAPESVSPKLSRIVIKPREAVEAKGKNWVVSTQGEASTRAAQTILHQGGNLIDAAIAASLTISVERPHSTGLGGGGFLIYHEAKTGKNFVLDFRERAPLHAAKDMYLDAKGNVIEDLSVSGSLAVGVPGLTRGLKLAHQKWGKKPWKSLFAPAIKLAAKGFPIYPSLAEAMKGETKALSKYPEAAKLFLHSDGTPKLEGEILVQKDLANTLKSISKNPDELYTGRTAKRIVKEITRLKGLINLQDLAEYAVKERIPAEADYQGFHIVSMPPPSSGGIHVIQILKLLEHDPLASYGFESSKSYHYIAQAMQQAFADRARYPGDPDFVKVPTEGLINSEYLADLRSKFSNSRARKKSEVFAGEVPGNGPSHTTHLTLMDREGNVVVSTQTINDHFGSDVVIPGTGIVMNNEMDDFAAKMNVHNGADATFISNANSIAPKKTPLSSMSPTIVFKNGMPILAIGAEGGTRIISSVAQSILNYLAYHQDLYTALASPRIHQQWSPDVLQIENQSIPSSVLRDLTSDGYVIERTPVMCGVMAAAREGDTLVGVSDPRDAGTSLSE